MRNSADKVSKGHTMGLAQCEKHCLGLLLSHLDHWEWPAAVFKRIQQRNEKSFKRKFVTPSGASVGIVHPRDIASISSQRGSSFLRVPEGIVLENLEVLAALLIWNRDLWDKPMDDKRTSLKTRVWGNSVLSKYLPHHLKSLPLIIPNTLWFGSGTVLTIIVNNPHTVQLQLIST